MAKKGAKGPTYPFTDLSRYGIELPFLSDEEVAQLVDLRTRDSWKVLQKTRAHMLTVYLRRCHALAKTHNPEAFKMANIADGIEIFTHVLDALGHGVFVPDIVSPEMAPDTMAGNMESGDGL